MDDEDSAVHTKLTNISSNNFKLSLKWSNLVSFGFNSSQNLIFTSVWSNNNSKEPSLTCLNLSSRKENWGWNIMSSLGELIFFLVFLLSNETFVVSFLHQMIRLSSHGRLVTQNTVGFNADTIDWNVHTVNNLNDISNLKEISMSLLFFAISHDLDSFALHLNLKLF
jgi:hypothetical protein